ncbi:MAG: hypothetical protein ABS85_09075 [Sphingobacteriales bacterium SCN 48-20]|uniref:transporter n=1 Tax=Terrimonas ferruginea TaxID=249 RepID=UPI00086B11D7|nr:transporter [Terrimonas ferruginea]MBN8784374.1 transporter [Terrimonas ferruginea]ODT92491.1 MAG: hypothetical protein ABS85_09075 [Sphingobacteriales bacterium SCN 48-20]OJW45806.1 MAG: hypothetical protein BGO56_01175 [Sphingobacteriales bacterium 48-107]
MKVLSALFILTCCSAPALAQRDSSTDRLKNRFSVFHPVPKALMRKEMETDRPDITESPVTVDAGHFQFEADLVKFKRSRDGGSGNRQMLVAPLTAKLGLTNSIDFQVAVETFRHEVKTEEGNAPQRYDACGSVTLRLKRNFCGNDDGKFAVAALPYIKLPADKHFEHHLVEGGMIIPMRWKLSEKWTLGVQEEVDYVADDREYDWQLLQSVAADYQLTKSLKGMIETYATYGIREHRMENYINLALQLSVLKNLAVDIGSIQGFQKNAEHQYYTGFAVRL